MDSIKEIEEKLGQFSESIPFILVVQKRDGDHITADNFSINHNQIALTRVLKSMIRKYSLQQKIYLSRLIASTRQLTSTEKFRQNWTPAWNETEHAFQHFDNLERVEMVFKTSIFNLENLMTINMVQSFLLCISPNDRKIFCQMADRGRDPGQMNKLVATMLLDYGRYYDFDPVFLLQKLPLVAQL